MEDQLHELEQEFQKCESNESKIAVLNILLSKFPLLFGYWLKLIDISVDPEKVWSRALDNCPVLDLWIPYLRTPFGSSEEAARVAVKKLGYHFQASPLWDILLERVNNDSEVIRQVITIPLYDYAKYYQIAFENGIETSEKLEKLSSELALKVSKKYAFESKFQRPYFHPHEMDQKELIVWDEYLNYTEQYSHNLDEIRQLYDRCLVSTAMYPRYWLRYIKWLADNDIEDEDVCSLALHYHNEKVFRLVYSRTLESKGNLLLARDQLLNKEDVKELVEFDRRNNVSKASEAHEYTLEYAIQTGDLSHLSLEQQLASPELFESDNIKPISLFPLWERDACPNVRKYADSLKASGDLKEFILVDATLPYLSS